MINYTVLASSTSYDPAMPVPLHSPDEIDVERFNTRLGDAHELGWVGQPLSDIRDLFVKQVVLADGVTEAIATLQVPGFIGVADAEKVIDPSGQTVSGHEELAQVLERDGLLICTFQWDKERYGTAYDTRQPLSEHLFKEGFIKNEAHHAGALVPAQRRDTAGAVRPAFAAHNEPGSYHAGMYGDDGFVTVAQRLVFPDFVTREQARGYTDSIICWMGFLNPFVKFPNDYNGGDPTKVIDAAALRIFLRNGLLAALGDRTAIAFLNDPLNMTYCAEYMYVALNTVLFPFNRVGLMDLLGNESQVAQILEIQAKHNQGKPTILTHAGDAAYEAALRRTPSNPQFDAFNIGLPVVPDTLPSLAQLMTDNGHPVAANSLPFPCFTISQILRRAFRVLLPRHKTQYPHAMAAAQSRMFQYLGAALSQQLGLDRGTLEPEKMKGVQQFMALVAQQLSQTFESDEAFDATIDQLMAQADAMLVGAGDRTYFVPPRIYTDLGQQDGDENLPQGWGFQLETVGATIARQVIGDLSQRVPIAWRDIKVESPMMRGDDVKLFQGAMIRAGIMLKADGIFGPASSKAVQIYQEQKQLSVTGVIDAATRAALLSPA
ncbi:MAG: peptidoglycan-binding protein [Cyanothece sp. SIO2G6]|nr:peptidoglycan-binding protein [Cyanothece sp. SIO2G6]